MQVVVMEVVVSSSPPSIPKNGKMLIEEYSDGETNGDTKNDLDSELKEEGLLDELQ
jgi:hypothetical protein